MTLGGSVPVPFRSTPAAAELDPSAPPPAWSRWRGVARGGGGGGAAAPGAPLEEAQGRSWAGAWMWASLPGCAAPEPDGSIAVAAGETWRALVAIPLSREGVEKKRAQGAGWKRGEGLSRLFIWKKTKTLMAVWSLGVFFSATNSTLNHNIFYI